MLPYILRRLATGLLMLRRAEHACLRAAAAGAWRPDRRLYRSQRRRCRRRKWTRCARASGSTSRCRCSTSPGSQAAATGDLGYSIQRNGVAGSAASSLERIGPTLLLMGAGLAIAIVVGIAAAIISAVRRNSPTDIALLGPRLRRHLEPGLPDRAPRPLRLLGACSRWAPSGGMLTPGAAVLDRRPPRPSDPAGVPAVDRPRRADHALHARVAARGAEPGLCPHRPRQGRHASSG